MTTLEKVLCATLAVFMVCVFLMGNRLDAYKAEAAEGTTTEFMGILKFKVDEHGSPHVLLVSKEATYWLSFPTKRDPKAPLNKPLKPGDEVSPLQLKAMAHLGAKATVTGGIFEIGPVKFLLVWKISFSE